MGGEQIYVRTLMHFFEIWYLVMWKLDSFFIVIELCESRLLPGLTPKSCRPHPCAVLRLEGSGGRRALGPRLGGPSRSRASIQGQNVSAVGEARQNPPWLRNLYF